MTFGPDHFEFLRKFVLQHSAIVIEAGKEYLVESRLAPLARDRGFASIGTLLDSVRKGGDKHLDRVVVEAMTTNETSFFRDLHPFEALRTEVIPRLLEARAGRRALRIWCAACSTGQEPYSIGMLLLEHFPALASWDVKILATDLAEEILARGKDASFSQLEVNRGLPAPMLVKYFAKDGTRWQVKPQLRKLVEFRQLNLAAPWSGMPTMDVVFLRNVLIYFSVETKRQILGAVLQLLNRDGVLFLGTAETTLGICDDYEKAVIGKAICYRPKCREGVLS
jgi:chemotaxis protein methyltransferase CheR